MIEPNSLFQTLLTILNPLMLIKGFWNLAYSIFFLANLAIFIILLLKNKGLLLSIRSLFRSKTPLPLLFLCFILLFHLISNVLVMEPLNNLTPCSIEEVYMGQQLLAEGKMPYEGYASRPLGPSVLLALSGAILPIDLTSLYSIMGLLCSLLIVIIIFLVVRQLTKSAAFSLLASLLYTLLSTTAFFASSHVETTLFSALLLLILMLLYLTDTKELQNAKLILFCTTLLLYTRIENLILFLPLGIYLLKNRSRLKSSIGFPSLILAYLLFIPSTILLGTLRLVFTQEDVAHSFGFHNLSIRLASYLPLLLNEFSIPLACLLAIGILYCIFNRKQAKLFLLVPLMIFLVYLFHAQYDQINPKYFFTLLPMLIVLVAAGGYWLSTLFRSRLWQLCAVILFFVLLMTLPNPIKFSRFSMPITVTSIISPGYFNSSNVVLYGPEDSIRVYHRYYNYTTLIAQARSNLSRYDYLIFIEGDREAIDALPAFENEMHYLEEQNNVTFEQDSITEVEVIFKIVRKEG